MNIQELVVWGKKKLLENGIEKYGSCIKMSQTLLSFVIKKDILYLHTHDTGLVNTKNTRKYKKLIKRACVDEPIEYLTKKVSFYSKDFFVNKYVLIPRPETELLIDYLLPHIQNKQTTLSIAEIGTGSGIVSIVLSSLLPNTNYIATDISKKAIKVAKKNALLHNTKNIFFINTSLLDGVEQSIDILVSNPPYIKNNIRLDKNISFEPQIALFGGRDGNEILKNVINTAYVKNVKILACEMGYDQRKSITTYIKKNYEYKSLVFYQDLYGHDRGFILVLDYDFFSKIDLKVP